MSFENLDLEKEGITVVKKLTPSEINEISKYVADTLFAKFSTLNFNYPALYSNIANLSMYYAKMPEGLSSACYCYKNSSIYFSYGSDINELKKLAVHEVIHHFQEVKTPGGRLYKLGLTSYLGSKTFGNSINEAAVQFMSAYATNEEREIVTYYGITLPTDSPNYYPIITNLIKQIGYLVGYSVLFESTFFADNKFYDSFKELLGESNAYKIQDLFDKIMSIEENVIKLSLKLRTEDLSNKKFKKLSLKIDKLKLSLKDTFFTTQNIILKSFFDKKINEISCPEDVVKYRNLLYSFTNLIGSSPKYSFFNDFYIQKMIELDNKFNNNSLTIVKQSKLSLFFQKIKGLFSVKSTSSELT